MILFALALLAAAPDAAPPATTPVSAPAPAVQPKDDLDKMVCHVDVQTGTRLGSHKECHTKREWIQNQNEQSRYLNQQTVLVNHP